MQQLKSTLLTQFHPLKQTESTRCHPTSKLPSYPSGHLGFKISSALTPAVQVQNFTERILRLPPLLITAAAAAAAEKPFQLGVQYAGDRPEIRGVATGGEEALLAVIEGLEARFQLLPLVGMAIHHSDAGGHPQSAHVTHFSKYFVSSLLLCKRDLSTDDDLWVSDVCVMEEWSEEVYVCIYRGPGVRW
ncbi:hypothetical protein Pfo_013954 [Paulownia fortunei]|nr:hypothetical protein Pfo_013954 [Paulownia fortunei]